MQSLRMFQFCETFLQSIDHLVPKIDVQIRKREFPDMRVQIQLRKYVPAKICLDSEVSG